MSVIDILLLVAAFICFAWAAFKGETPTSIGLVPLGLALWVLSILIP